MPGPQIQRHILDQTAVASDQQMGGDGTRSGRDRKIGVASRIESAEEEIVDPGAAEFPWRKADVVDDQEVDDDATGAFIPVARRAALGPSDPSRRLYCRRRMTAPIRSRAPAPVRVIGH
jgi:hypothetical protein